MKKLVKSLKQDGSFESQWGTFFKHIIEFEDGMLAEYLSKTETQQNALTNACNIVGESDIAKIIEIADAFKEWVLNDVKPSKTKSNDLPF